MQKIALILAAGKGTRMKSQKIKILHDLVGKPMVQWSIDAATQCGLSPVLVVGHQEQQVREALAGQDIRFARQSVPRGTGHAVQCSLSSLPEQGTVLVMCGDTPLFRAATLEKLLAAHQDKKATVLTSFVEDAGSYGRIVRDEKGVVCGIVEAAEATTEQLEINEINTGVYVFDIAWLRQVLPLLEPHAPKNEVYLTDTVAHAHRLGKAQAVVLSDFSESQGVNDRWALAAAGAILQQRIIKKHALSGVGFEDLTSNTIEANVLLDKDCYIERGAILRGNTAIQSGSTVGAYSVIENCTIGSNVKIHPHSHCSGAQLKDFVNVGPFARLREGTIIGNKAKIGNFVETKKAIFGDGAKASHLSYIGDAEIGPQANIGAGTITCNYDGFKKHKTAIGSGAFIGSNSALVAPVSIGAGAVVGAGATITVDVPENAIAVARGEQKNYAGAALRYRKKREEK